MFVDILRELGIDREVDIFAYIVASGKLDGKLNDGIRPFAGMDVRFILFRGEYLFEQHAQLYLSDIPPRLDVAQYPFQPAYILCQCLHFAEAFLHALQLFGDQAERLSDPVVQGLLQFLVNGDADIFQSLFRVGNQ